MNLAAPIELKMTTVKKKRWFTKLTKQQDEKSVAEADSMEKTGLYHSVSVDGKILSAFKNEWFCNRIECDLHGNKLK